MRCKARARAAPASPRRFAGSSARRPAQPLCSRPVAEALERVLAETNAARAKIEEALAATAFEPKELERAEERLFALRALARKHKVHGRRSAGAGRAPRSRAGALDHERGAGERSGQGRGSRRASL